MLNDIVANIPRWAFPAFVVAFNVILVIAVPVILLTTASRLNECLKHVPSLPYAHPPGLAECQSNWESGTALGFLLIAIGILADLGFLAIWLWIRHIRRRDSRIFSS